jgi:hypothetical protein
MNMHYDNTPFLPLLATAKGGPVVLWQAGPAPSQRAYHERCGFTLAHGHLNSAVLGLTDVVGGGDERVALPMRAHIDFHRVDTRGL